MTTSALNPTPGSRPRPTARTLPVSRAILYATLVVGVLDAADGVVFLGLQSQKPDPGPPGQSRPICWTAILSAG